MNRIVLFLLTLLISNSLFAQTCKFDSIARSTPDGTFVDNGDGTVTDTRHGLIWKRCAEGQTWDGSTCTGDAVTYNW